MRKIYHVRLFGEERGYMEELVRVGKAAARTLMHARILLKADEGPGGPAWSDDQIVEALEVSRSTDGAGADAVCGRRARCRAPPTTVAYPAPAEAGWRTGSAPDRGGL